MPISCPKWLEIHIRSTCRKCYATQPPCITTMTALTFKIVMRGENSPYARDLAGNSAKSRMLLDITVDWPICSCLNSEIRRKDWGMLRKDTGSQKISSLKPATCLRVQNWEVCSQAWLNVYGQGEILKCTCILFWPSLRWKAILIEDILKQLPHLLILLVLPCIKDC